VGFRVTTIYPIAATMGQQKWLWLSRTPRPLLDLERIEGASTSVTGSAQLLLHGPRSLVAILGSTTLLLALGIGPLVQQAIRTVTCGQIVPGVNASMPVANYISARWANRIGAGDFVVAASVKGTLLNGLVNPQSNDSTVSVSCSTGNCTWPAFRGVTHTSIGLCYACFDTSALIVNQSTLPSGLRLDSQVGLVFGPVDNGVNSFAAEMKLFTPEFAGVVYNSICNIIMLAYTTAPCSDSPGSAYASCNNSIENWLGHDFRALAVSCALYPCVQRFHGNVSNNQLDEFVVSTSLASTTMTVSVPEYDNPFLNYTALEIPCLLDNQLYDLSNFSTLDPQKYSFMDVVVNATSVSVPYQCVYILDGIYAAALRAYICGEAGGDDANLLTGTCSANIDSPGVHCGDGRFWLEKFWASGTSNLTTVSDIMAQFATVVSNQFRQAGTSLYVQPRPSTSEDLNGIRQPALGAVHTTTLCVSLPGRGCSGPCCCTSPPSSCSSSPSSGPMQTVTSLCGRRRHCPCSSTR
jgi:hypothetical protein